MGEVIIAACGGAMVGGIFGIIQWALQRRAAKGERQNGTAAGVKILLYDKIKYLAKEHIGAREISAEDLEDLMAMHKIYHNDLGGNGYLDSLMASVKRLPIK